MQCWPKRIVLTVAGASILLLTNCLGTLPTASVDWKKEGRLVVGNATTDTFTVITVNGRTEASMVPPGQVMVTVQFTDRAGDNRDIRSQTVYVVAESMQLGVSQSRTATIYTDGRVDEVEFRESDFPNRPRN